MDESDYSDINKSNTGGVGTDDTSSNFSLVTPRGVLSKSNYVFVFIILIGALFSWRLLSWIETKGAMNKDEAYTSTSGTEYTPCPTCTHVTHTVDLSKRRSTDQLLKTNIVVYAHEYVDPDLFQEILSEQRIGTVVLSPVDLVKDSTSLEDLKHDLQADTKLTAIVQGVTKQGGTIELLIANNIPKWLSSDPHNTASIFPGMDGEEVWHTSPPKDYVLWKQMVEVLVEHFSVTLQANVIYTFGSEPDNYFVGNESEFFEMYKYFVEGALEVDPNAKVGGPTPSHYTSNRFTKDNPFLSNAKTEFKGSSTKNNQPIIKNFIEFAREQNLPINHIVYHQYPAPSPVPTAFADWVVAEKEITAWLREFGFNNTEIILDDWPEWRPSEYSDTEYQAAWVASSLASMAKYTSKTTPTYLGLIDLGAFSGVPSIQNAGFVGGNGLLTTQGIKKPIYNFYTMLSQMKGQLVDVSSNDTFAVGLASADNESVSVLVSNFIPQDSLLLQNSFGIPVTRDEMQQALQEIRDSTGVDSPLALLDKVRAGALHMDDLSLSNQNIKERLSKIQQLAVVATKRRTETVESTIRIDQIQSGTWRIDEYVIDSTHANSYATAMGEDVKSLTKVDKPSQDVLKQLVSDLNMRTDLLSGKTRSETITVSGNALELVTNQTPNSVNLLVLTRLSE